MTSRSTGTTTLLTLALAVAITACASLAAESEAPESEAAAASAAGLPSGGSTGQPEQSAPADPPVSDAGRFTVSGTEFAVNFLNRCIPFDDVEGNIDLQPIAQGAQLNLYLSGGTTDVSVQGSAIEQEFGSISFGEDPVVHESTVDGDRWTGSATVGDTLGSGDTVEISWDVMIPGEAQDCSL